MKTISTLVIALALQISAFANNSNTTNPGHSSATGFHAILNNTTGRVNLDWNTLTEANLNYFMVERSVDGINYRDAAMVFAYGNTESKSEYAFNDNISKINASIIYYRIRTVGNDGNFIYSDVRVIRLGKKATSTNKLFTYPNPANTEVLITVPAAWQQKKVVFEIISANGQPVNYFETANSNQTESINISNLTNGFYVVKATCMGEIAQQNIVKK